MPYLWEKYARCRTHVNQYGYFDLSYTIRANSFLALYSNVIYSSPRTLGAIACHIRERITGLVPDDDDSSM